MCSGAERHARVNLDRNAFLIRRFQPGRDNDQALANRDGLVVLFPGLHPILVSNRLEDRSGQGLDHTQVIERLLQFMARFFGFFVHGQIGAHAHRSAGSAFVLIVAVSYPAFHGHAARREARQHLGHGFGQFAVHSEGDFEPGVHSNQ